MSRQHDVEQLALVVAELVEEFRTTELHDWRPSREHPDYTDRSRPLPKTVERRVHRTSEPGLLEQLRRGPGRRRAVAKPEPTFVEVPRVEGGPELVHVPTTADAFALIADMAPTPGQHGTGGGSRSKPGSKPPAQLHAAEALVDLTVAIAQERATVRAAAGRGRGRALPPPEMLRDLLDLVLRAKGDGWLVDDITVKVLLRRSRSWSAAARVALSYDAPVAELRVHCPICRGRMLVRSDATSDVWCGGIRGRIKEGPVRPGEVWPMLDRGCGATWPRISWIDLLEDLEPEDSEVG